MTQRYVRVTDQVAKHRLHVGDGFGAPEGIDDEGTRTSERTIAGQCDEVTRRGRVGVGKGGVYEARLPACARGTPSRVDLMSDSAPVAVWPILHYHDTEAALAFLVEVLGFRAVLVTRDGGGSIAHCELRWPEGGTVLFGAAAHTEGVHGSMRPGTAAM